MSGTKYAPARLSAAEQARIQQALEEASHVNEVMGRAAATSAACRVAIAALDQTTREQIAATIAAAEGTCHQIEASREALAHEVQRVQQGLNHALVVQAARALPVLSQEARKMAGNLEERARDVEEQTSRIGHLVGQVAESEAAAERYRDCQRRAHFEAALAQLESRLRFDASFRWVADEAQGLLDDGRRRAESDIDEEETRGVERRIEELRTRAFESERVYHERRRVADLVSQLFRQQGFEVAQITEPAHGSTADIASTFKPTEEHLLVTIGVRQPWARDEDQHQRLHLTMETRSAVEQTKDPFCLERLKEFARRARELGLYIGDVLQPLPGGGYECVMSEESVLAEEQATVAAAAQVRQSIR